MSTGSSGGSGSGIAGLYDLRETLGKGHYATVKAARHVFTGEKVAVKVIDKSKLDEVSRGSLLKEVLCMKLVQHPNVVKLYEVIDTRDKLYLVLELGQGDLYDLIKKRGLSEGVARGYFTQILAAVSYCHKLHVAHRDLKPENVVYFPPPPPSSSSSKSTSGTPSSFAGGDGPITTTPTTTTASASSPLGVVKLTDFGFSNKFCPGEKLETSCGSLAYSAPEILLGDSYDAPAVDVWSLGVLLYVLVVGVAPFQEANDSETLTMIMDVKYRVPEGVSESCRDLISRMLLRDPAKRASISHILKHPWVNSSGGGCGDGVGVGVGGVPGVMTSPLIEAHRLSEEERERVLAKMVGGGVVDDPELVRKSLESDAYNYLTSTFYLLAEKMLRERKPHTAASVTSSRKPSPSKGTLTSSSSHGTSASLESLSNVGCNHDNDGGGGDEELMLRNDNQDDDDDNRGVLKSVESLSLVGSSSCSSGLSSKMTVVAAAPPQLVVVVPRRKSTIREADEEEEEEENSSSSAGGGAAGATPPTAAAAAASSSSGKKSGGGGLFGWFLRKKSSTTTTTTPSSRIYKTRSCSELKVLKATSPSSQQSK